MDLTYKQIYNVQKLIPNNHTGYLMQAFIISTSSIALAEMGDKTQLLAFVLAAKFRRPLPIILGILVATLFNHTLASLLGVWLSTLITADLMHWIVGLGFIITGMWTLIPDKYEEESIPFANWGVFLTTLGAFFLAEIGDKTQIATFILAAQYHNLLEVVAGTTVGMLLADVPAVFLGQHFANKLPLKWVRLAAAALFLILGIIVLLKI